MHAFVCFCLHVQNDTYTHARARIYKLSYRYTQEQKAASGRGLIAEFTQSLLEPPPGPHVPYTYTRHQAHSIPVNKHKSTRASVALQRNKTKKSNAREAAFYVWFPWSEFRGLFEILHGLPVIVRLLVKVSLGHPSARLE